MNSNLFDDTVFLTDGGLETTLIFQQGIALRDFAAFELLKDETGRQALRNYYQPYLGLSSSYGTGFILETPTWRANFDWAAKLGYSRDELNALNREAIRLARSIADDVPATSRKILVSGNIGPRGDGYKATSRMTAEQAKLYHQDQVQVFAEAGADLITALTMNYSEEAIGIVQAAKDIEMPVVISFTVETDGTLPDGESLREAIEKTDDMTKGYATHFMINCAHPEHFLSVLTNEGHWKERIKGIRANASTKSHAQLDESETLDPGDKNLLADGYLSLRQLLPNLKVIGGCCGTDHTHVASICQRLMIDIGPSQVAL